MKTKVAIIGAGPAGLTAGYLLSKEDLGVIVLEADPVYIGGISRTVTYKGFHFDIGGHRFFSKSKAVEDLWTEILPNDMLVRARSSRIFYGGKFFSYPLKPFEALVKLGVFKSTLCVLSWLKARLFPVRNPRVGKQSVRQTPLQHILQKLHRKSLGHELQGNLRRLGRTTDQRAFARQRDQECADSAALQRRPQQSHQDAHPFVSLSAPRSRHDVGNVRRKDERAGRQARDGLQSDALFV
jgi:phytoene dehydrogenase-like protein